MGFRAWDLGLVLSDSRLGACIVQGFECSSGFRVVLGPGYLRVYPAAGFLRLITIVWCFGCTAIKSEETPQTFRARTSEPALRPP